MSDNNATDAYVTAEWIRRTLPDLGGLAPADAVADPEGRKKLDDLLTELAGHHVRLTRLGLPAVNPSDIRKALGIEHAPPSGSSRAPARPFRAGPVKRNALLDELGTALTGGDVDSVAFFNAKTGAVEHFMHNLGDQENARIAQAGADPELRKVVPVTTEIRYGIMSDFIGSVEDIVFAGKLRTAISGKGAFRRFRETVDEDDALRRRWLAYRTKRHYHLALDWLHKLGLDPSKYGVNSTELDWEAPSHTAAAAPEQPPSASAAGPSTPEAPMTDSSSPTSAAAAAETSEPTGQTTEPSIQSAEPAGEVQEEDAGQTRSEATSEPATDPA
jgi:hypothetical protein